MIEAKPKYGIRHEAGKIIAVTEFPLGLIQEGFREIEKEKYNEFLNALKANPYSTYNQETNTIEGDYGQLQEAELQKTLRRMRKRLHRLSTEMDLQVKMEEEIGENQSKFNQLRIEYESLKKPR